MRNIKGYVFLAYFEDNNLVPMFGSASEKNSSDGNYGNFEINDLTPYNTIKKATAGAKDFLDKRKVKKVILSHLEMKLAETPEENKSFENKEDICLVAYLDKGVIPLFGPYIFGVSTMPATADCIASRLSDNGYTPFNSKLRKSAKVSWATKGTAHEQAIYAAGDLVRQGGVNVRLSTFRLEKLEKI